MKTFSNGFQTKVQKNQLLKETLKKQLADPSYWYKTTTQQQLDKIEQEEAEALWVKNNPNASLAELFYPSMRKPTPKISPEINKDTRLQVISPTEAESTTSLGNSSYQNASSNAQVFSSLQNNASTKTKDSSNKKD